MNRNCRIWIMQVIFFTIILTGLTGCGTKSITIGAYEHCDSTEVSMQYQEFNGAKDYKLNVDKDNRTIQVDVKTESGSLDVYIVEDGKELTDSIYEGHGITTTSFTVTAPDEGIYIIHIEAEHHKGGYSFGVRTTD